MCEDYWTPLAFKRSHEVKALCDVYYDQCLQDGYVTYCRYVVSNTIFFNLFEVDGRLTLLLLSNMGEYLLTFGDMLIDWPSLSSDVHAHQILTPSLIIESP